MKKTLQQIILFIGFVLILLIANNSVKNYLIANELQDYNTYLLVRTASNVILSIVSLFVIKKLDLFELGGLTSKKTEHKKLLIFPLVFLVALNLLFADDISSFTTENLIILTVYCLSIGISEELSLRSVLLPLFIRHFGNSKKSIIKSIFVAAAIFGALHFIKFDKGIYGEVSQFLFATFIGVMFGALLIITKRIYPLIIIHMLIDFAAKIDDIGSPLLESSASETSLAGAIVTTLFTLPCLFYGMYIMKKYIPEESSQ
ncbi:CPBP family intramembrane glutamic endopeptidase [uncultured Tenacibaculum sp.]|uniref:CPBP family intramembrane glutamic endopeptidase n=1 Tax=uncultured Tenacibaculum sp. TaxID=174713 RepID=UPI00262BB88E|nr:CPBP family intramembrane glutamic endopeptidase [uncultured Tenacibaculum sp.]